MYTQPPSINKTLEGKATYWGAPAIKLIYGAVKPTLYQKNYTVAQPASIDKLAGEKITILQQDDHEIEKGRDTRPTTITISPTEVIRLYSSIIVA